MIKPWAPCIGAGLLATEPPGKSQASTLFDLAGPSYSWIQSLPFGEIFIYLFLVKFFMDVDFPCIIPKLLSLLLATRFSVPFFSSMISGALKRESVGHFSCV